MSCFEVNRDRRLQLYQRANRPTPFAVAGERHQKYTNGLLFLLSFHHPFTAMPRLDRVKKRLWISFFHSNGYKVKRGEPFVRFSRDSSRKKDRYRHDHDCLIRSRARSIRRTSYCQKCAIVWVFLLWTLLDIIITLLDGICKIIIYLNFCVVLSFIGNGYIIGGYYIRIHKSMCTKDIACLHK